MQNKSVRVIGRVICIGGALAISCGFCLAMSGCIVVYVNAPMATHAGIVTHEQSASNLVNNASVPITQKLMDKVADKLTGIQGAEVSGNTVKGIETTGAKQK